ncbi:MAG: hypothetical protein Phog2KO_51340 [Phototrophicaceae bacterium]
MTIKEKRKTNPRRRVLIKLIFGLVLIVSVLAVGIQALRPTGAQIVYIAPDDNGYDAIWIADVNDPEHPRQLTHHKESRILYFQVSNKNSIVFYRTYPIDNSIPNEFRTINLDTGLQRIIPLCYTYFCRNYKLSPDGQWLTFEDSDEELIRVVIQNLQTLEQQILFETERGYLGYNQPHPRWIENTGLLSFRTTFDDISDYVFYNIEENQIVETFSVNIGIQTPIFSDDGSFYSYNSGRQNINIHHRDNPTDILYQIHYMEASSLDWHDDRVLISETRLIDNSDTIRDLNIYNLLTGENETLTSSEREQFDVSFNMDGSQILYSTYVPNEYYRQFMLFDMESREEITLPIVGGRPQWVNGGQ